MKAQFLKIAGVKSEREFYKKYPTEEAFFEAHPEAQMMAMGGYVGHDGKRHQSKTPTWSGNVGYAYGGYIPEMGAGGFYMMPNGMMMADSEQYMAMGGTNNPGFKALPNYVQQKIVSNMAYGGNMGPSVGDEMEVTPEEIEMLRQQGYQFEII